MKTLFLTLASAASVLAQCPNAGVVQFANVNSQMVLDVENGSMALGAPLIQYSNHQGPNQEWTIVPVSGLYLGTAANGAVTIFSCNAGKATTLWTAPQYSDAETPTGTIDGKNRVFTLAHTPAAAPLVILNGVVLKSGSGSDYTLSGATITFTAKAAVPAASDTFQAFYRY